jgi:hypothetical protein
VGVVPTPAQACVLSFLCRHAGNTFPFSHSTVCIRTDLRALFLSRRVFGKLEMSSLQAIIFQGGIVPKLIWWQMLLLRSSKMGRLGSRRRYLLAAIPVRLEDRADMTFSQIMRSASISLIRIMRIFQKSS